MEEQAFDMSFAICVFTQIKLNPELIIIQRGCILGDIIKEAVVISLVADPSLIFIKCENLKILFLALE